MRPLLPLLLCLTLVAEPRLAAANPAPVASSAIELGASGLEAYARGDWERALDQFKSADALAHSPVFVLYQARCHRNLGRLLAARALYTALLDEPVPAAAPGPWRRAVESGSAELALLQTRIPSVRIEIVGSVRNTQILLDGRALDLEGSRGHLELDPGPHSLEVQHPDAPVERLQFELREGDRDVRQTLSLQAAASPVPVVAPPPARGRAVPSSARPLGYAAAAVGVTGLVLGSVSGLVAIQQTRRLKARCGALGCDPNDRDDAERAGHWADLSTASFIVGGSLLALGGVLLFVVPDRSGWRAGVVARGAF